MKPTINLRRSDFTQEEIAWIDYKYRVAEMRAVSGQEISRVGESVPYQYKLSQQFVHDTLQPGISPSNIRIRQEIPGYNVDEFVSKHLGGRQVTANQNIAPERANQLMGTLEYNAVRDLPKGTQINGFNINWIDD